LLDEPSSGMDAASKRFLWSVIQRRTAQCCVILTTHSMEECEALCSRIGVMVDGSLRCLGPVQSLKSKYGQGYKVDLRYDPVHCKPAELILFLQRSCPAMKLEEHAVTSGAMTLSLPTNAAPLSQIFGHLESAGKLHHVLESSITQCTLEQVFLQMASQQAAREDM